MKKATLFLSAALLSFFASPVRANDFVTYAYLPAPAILYDANGAEICTLPATYFTVLCGDSAEGKYPVSYLDLSGYLRSADVEIVDYEPVTKFPTLSATPRNDGMAVNLRDLPDQNEGKVLVSVPADATLTLYGGRTGSELFAGAGTLWQYVRYTDSRGISYHGYIYAPQLTCDPVVPNVIEKVVHDVPTVSETEATLEWSNTSRMILIAAMCVPAGLIMLVLFYRPDCKRTPRHRKDD